MTALLSNVSYSIDRWMCRHSDQISSVFNVIGIIWWVAVIADCLIFGWAFANELYASPDVMHWVFCGSWIVGCVMCMGFSCYWIMKCCKAIKEHGWRTSW